MRILLVEDDKKIAAFVSKGLEQEGFLVELSENGEEGLFLAQSEHYDAAIVDIMLPRLSGLDLITALREEGDLTPVLVLSARDSVDDRVLGLQCGGDDYLTKPFAFSELIARIKALIRRSNAIAEPTTLKTADLELDLMRRRAFRGGREIELQAKEFSLLEYLLRNKGRVVSKIMIMENVWGYDFDPQTNVVESRISRLRDKIDNPFDIKLIQTVRGAGYVIDA